MPHGAIPFPFGDCRICNDKATGVHYGVATCEGCKGFYKRSIPKGDKYRCYFGGKCIISPENRNRCKACRFCKCLEQGMAVEAVKMGRIPKVEKERALEQAAAQRIEADELQLSDNAGSGESRKSSQSQEKSEGKGLSQKRSSGSDVCENGEAGGCLPEGPEGPQSKKPFIESGSSVINGPDETGLFSGKQLVHVPYSGHQQRHGACHASVIPTMVHGLQAQKPPGLLKFGPPGCSDVTDMHSDRRNGMTNGMFRSGCTFRKSSGSDAGTSWSGSNTGTAMCAGADSNTNSVHHFNRGSRSPDLKNCADMPVVQRNSFCMPVTVKTENDSAVSNQSTSGSSGSQFSGSQRSAYSPGLIKMLFNQVIQSENANQKEKVLQKLARSCSQEGFSSGLGLLQSVVTVEKPGRSVEAVGINNSCSSAGSLSQSPDMPSLTGPTPSCSYSGMSVSRSTNAIFTPEMSSNTSLSRPLTFLPASAPHNYSLTASGCGAPFAHQVTNQEPRFQDTFGDSSHTTMTPYYPLSSETAQYRKRQASHPSFQNLQSQLNARSSHCQMYQTASSRSFDENDTVSASQQGLFKDEFSFSAGIRNNISNGTVFSHPPFYKTQHPQRPERVTRAERSGSFENSGSTTATSEFTDFRNRELHSSQSSNQLAIPEQSTKEYLDLNYLCKEEQFRDKDEALSYDGLSSVTSGDSVQVSNIPEEVDIEMDETVRTLENSIYTSFELEEKIKFRDTWLRKQEMGSEELPKHTTDEVWAVLMNCVQSTNNSVIRFCKSVPGFVQLDSADQEVLLKRAYYDVWMLANSQFFVDGESYLSMEDGTFYVRELMEHVIGKENVRMLHMFAQQFNALGLSQVEVAILCCIQLTAPGHDQPDLKNPREIQKLNSYYLDLLVSVVTHTHLATCSRVLVDIFRLIPLLAEVNRLQREIIASFSISSPAFKSDSTSEEGSQAGVKEESSASGVTE